MESCMVFLQESRRGCKFVFLLSSVFVFLVCNVFVFLLCSIFSEVQNELYGFMSCVRLQCTFELLNLNHPVVSDFTILELKILVL
jgi:hypothetical protein